MVWSFDGFETQESEDLNKTKGRKKIKKDHLRTPLENLTWKLNKSPTWKGQSSSNRAFFGLPAVSGFQGVDDFDGWSQKNLT